MQCPSKQGRVTLIVLAKIYKTYEGGHGRIGVGSEFANVYRVFDSAIDGKALGTVKEVVHHLVRVTVQAMGRCSRQLSRPTVREAQDEHWRGQNVLHERVHLRWLDAAFFRKREALRQNFQTTKNQRVAYELERRRCGCRWSTSVASNAENMHNNTRASAQDRDALADI